jgi:hypothetical protein
MRNRVVVVLRLLCVHWCVCIAGGCTSPEDTSPAPARASDPPTVGREGPDRPIPAMPALCDRTGRDDAVRALFCADTAPGIRSLLDVQQALGLRLTSADQVASYGKVVLLAHSTALSGDVVSALNPRAIIANGDVLLAFSRGVQQLELAIADRATKLPRLNFYLLRFEQACNLAADGCRPGDLYTPRVESDWLNVTLDDDEGLKNTPSDCRQCHQRGREDPLLLMRELEGPWTHFFGPDQDEPKGLPEPSGSALLRDYLRAKGDEPYANLPEWIVRATVGFTLEALVSGAQPLIFDGSAILNERWPWRDGGIPSEPERSATWYAAYAAFKRGEQLPLPYFTPRVMDPGKQAQLTAAYQSYREGSLAPEDLPDLADIFSDDPQTRAEIGLQTEPGAAPKDVLIQACASCHNDVLDQSLSRARFSVALGTMSRAEQDVAIARIQLPRTADGAMPPPGRRQIAEESLQPFIEYLQRSDRSEDDDASLDRAAHLGMAVSVSSTAKPVN